MCMCRVTNTQSDGVNVLVYVYMYMYVKRTQLCQWPLSLLRDQGHRNTSCPLQIEHSLLG